MITLKLAAGHVAPVLSVAAVMLCGSTALAQNDTRTCRPAQVIPVSGAEPAAKLVVDAPLAGPLASRGVVIIPYCAENMRFAPIFGPGALAVSARGPRSCHCRRCALALGGRQRQPAHPAGPAARSTQSAVELVDANHQFVDKGAVTFEVPKETATRVPF